MIVHESRNSAFRRPFGAAETGTEVYLAAEKAGIRDEDMLILSATGTHRRQTREEHVGMVTEAVYDRIRVEDPLKLLPPPSEYDAHINGKPARLTVDAAQELITRDILPEGRVVITF